ncbi:secretion/DNA translocation related TadE-like protein [Microbacterium ginsengiterrae]|uniref:Secretion/DNA translocation related TadE-like protein n=1 Tax=Microbacterium ginsengiterrae TaxID=546115 RepID=A0A7W9FCC0_9MICO|nr:MULTISPECIES: Rv3654c family TadE-like protein [Microbacterium]MBB5742049.1 secretion/DNA translocation related TadE-like protein [Microbacterium ginsengiterrae]
MAGTALSAAVLSVAGALAIGLAAVGGAAVTAQRAAGAADAAALAAADAASGAIVTDDEPCALAARVAAASRATLVECAVDGLMVTVQVQAAYSGLAAASRARAGPPEGS